MPLASLYYWAMSEFGLAFEANVGLVTLDLRGADAAQLAVYDDGRRPTSPHNPRSGPHYSYASIETACAATRMH